MPAPQIDDPVQQLRDVLKLLSEGVERLASEWESSPTRAPVGSGKDRVGDTVSHAEYDAVKVILAACGSLESLVLDPCTRLSTLSMSYILARALHVAAEYNVAELLARGGHEGIRASDLAASTGIEEGKLCRIMRTLTSHHVFQEAKEDCFANNHVSRALVDDAPFRAFIVSRGKLHYAASDIFLDTLSNPAVSHTYDSNKTAFQQAVGTQLSLFDWMQQMVPETDADWRPLPLRKHPCEEDDTPVGFEDSSQRVIPRPEKQQFQLVMAGVGRVYGQGLVHDFPWKNLNQDATVVDVGGGIGSFCMQLHGLYPNLNLVVQDRGPIIQQAVGVWQTKHPSAVSRGKVKLVVHDFFKPNPVIGAEVYWLRHIIHDWSDDQAIAILSPIAESMSSKSRVLIADIVMNTTLGCDEIQPAPKPLLPNYGRAMGFAHMMDLNIMMMVNGKERTPAEFRRIIQAAGLKMVKIWECHGPLSIIECRLP